MRVKNLISLVSVCLILATGYGCKSPTEKVQTNFRITQEEALEIAKKEFEKRFPNRLQEYVVSIKGSPEDTEWRVWFQWKTVALGNYEVIFVDKRNGRTTLVRGY